MERESAQTKRRCISSASSESTACSSTSSRSAQLPYKNVCILCNQPVHLFPLHKDLAKTRMKRDAEAIGLAFKWFEENNPFDQDRDKKLLVSFSTGFTSTANDAVNAERAAEVGREMQTKLDGQSVRR